MAKQRRMTKEQESHLNKIIGRFIAVADSKYRSGQKEHGGDLWKKLGVINMLMEELVDAFVYCATLEEQFQNPDIIDPRLRDKDKEKKK